jgi:hypothetical protein
MEVPKSLRNDMIHYTLHYKAQWVDGSTFSKGGEHNRPQTLCRITAQGRKRHLDYLAVLEQVLLDAA